MHRGEVVGVPKFSASTPSNKVRSWTRYAAPGDATALALTALQAQEVRGSSFSTATIAILEPILKIVFSRAQASKTLRSTLTLLLVSYANSSGSEEHLLPDEVREMSEHASAVMAQAVRTIDVVAQLSANTYAVMLRRVHIWRV